jgi:hypothetical protein
MIADKLLEDKKITQDEYNELEKLGMNKIASKLDFLKAIGKFFQPTNVAKTVTKSFDAAGNPVEVVVDAVKKPSMFQSISVPLAVSGATGVLAKEELLDPFLQKKKENEAYDLLKVKTPQLQSVDDEKMKDLFGVIQTFSPRAATNPLVSGALINKMVEFEGVDSNLVKDLAQIQNDKSGSGLFGKLLEGGTSFMSTLGG